MKQKRELSKWKHKTSQNSDTLGKTAKGKLERKEGI